MKVIDSLFKFIANTITDVSKTTKGILPIKFGGTGMTDFRTAYNNQYNGNVFSAVSVPSGTATKIGSITLAPGVYLLITYGDFASNGTGYRSMYLAGEGTTTVRYNINRDYRQAVNGGLTTFLNFNARYTVVKLGGYRRIIPAFTLERGWA